MSFQKDDSKKKFLKVTAACDRCRNAKVKCDGNRPCKRCLRLNSQDQCNFSVRKKRGPKNRNGASFQKTNFQLQEGVFQILPQPPERSLHFISEKSMSSVISTSKWTDETTNIQFVGCWGRNENETFVPTQNRSLASQPITLSTSSYSTLSSSLATSSKSKETEQNTTDLLSPSLDQPSELSSFSHSNTQETSSKSLTSSQPNSYNPTIDTLSPSTTLFSPQHSTQQPCTESQMSSQLHHNDISTSNKSGVSNSLEENSNFSPKSTKVSNFDLPSQES